MSDTAHMDTIVAFYLADHHGPFSVAPRGVRKYYGTDVVDCFGDVVETFWRACGEPSTREKESFGGWTPERWKAYVCNTHWESQVALDTATALADLLNVAYQAQFETEMAASAK